MGSDTKAKPAYVIDLDEEGHYVGGTKRSARQRPHVSQKSRSDEKRKSKSDSGTGYKALMSGAIQEVVGMEKEVKMERRKSSASTKSPSKSHNRPPSAHGNKAFPKVAIPRNDHPSHFGISTPTGSTPVVSQYSVSQYPTMSQNIPIRPRAVTTRSAPARPLSYHTAYTGAGYGTGPPLSASAYYAPPPSYPPPSPGYMHYAATPQQEYFTPRTLSQRLGAADPISRTSSAYGSRDPPMHQQIQDAYEDGYASATERSPPRRRPSIRTPTRRDSLSRTSMQAEIDYDREAMPPPPPPARPGILRNRTTEYHIDRTVPDPVYREARPSYRESSSTRRPSTHRNSVSYDLGPDNERVRVETANTSQRRQSYYGQSAATFAPTPASNMEDKMREASTYQEDVSGPSVPLTAEALRRRHAGSSRSTKSSGSRDESDYRKSATTRTTRSGSGEDGDFTIKVKGGQARVMVGGAQIDCTDGGEIEIKRQKSIRNGSERSNSEYGGRIEDRRSRLDRPQGRSRKGSVSGHSYTRSTPHYQMGNFI
jgi:hypothetical protein